MCFNYAHTYIIDNVKRTSKDLFLMEILFCIAIAIFKVYGNCWPPFANFARQ